MWAYYESLAKRQGKLGEMQRIMESQKAKLDANLRKQWNYPKECVYSIGNAIKRNKLENVGGNFDSGEFPTVFTRV